MANEKAQIQSVKNDVIIVNLPYLGDAKTTYLTADLAAAGIAATVKDNIGLANNDYLLLGEPGSQTAEIVKIGAAVTRGSAMTISACVYAHSAGTKVTQIRWNQCAIYGSTSASDTAPTIIGSAENLDVAHGRNEIKASTTYAYYYARYYNVQTTTYSPYSDSVASGGLTSKARGEIKREFLSMFNEKVDALITDDWLNRTINRWQRELLKRKKTWNCLRAVSISDLVEGQQGYTSPTDIFDSSEDSFISVKLKGEYPLSYTDATVFRELTSDHTGTTVSTAASVGGTTLTLTDSSDITQQNGNVYCKGVSIGYTLNTESTGVLSGITTCVAITAFADAGSGYTTVTASGHGFSDGDTCYIGSTRNYDGEYTVSGVAGDDFNIIKTFVADDATGACSTVDDSITEALSVGDEVWQVFTSGQPSQFTIDGKIKLYPIPDSSWDGTNLTVEHWKKFPDLDDDSDSTLFQWPENCYLYLNYQAGIRRKLSDSVVLARKAEWRDELEDLVSGDSDDDEIRIGPRNIYNVIY